MVNAFAREVLSRVTPPRLVPASVRRRASQRIPGWRPDRALPHEATSPVEETQEHDTRPVIVLGGGSDIGVAIAREFVARGAEAVVLAGRDPEQMRQHALEVGIGVRIDTVDFDARRTDTHVLAMEEAFTRAGEAQAVVLAFGVLGDTRSYEANPALAGGAAITNFAGGVTASLAAVRALARQERPGTLVVLSSAAVIRPRPSNYIYGATKAGLDFFARGLADSARGRGVRVLVVRPGFVETKMTEGMRARLLRTTADRVAVDVVDDVEAGRQVTWSPRILRWLSVPIRLVPGFIVRRA